MYRELIQGPVLYELRCSFEILNQTYDTTAE